MHGDMRGWNVLQELQRTDRHNVRPLSKVYIVLSDIMKILLKNIIF